MEFLRYLLSRIVGINFYYMTTNSNFNFTNKTIVTLELPFSEHIEELRQFFFVFGIILLLTV
jgi:hypothetical protein